MSTDKRGKYSRGSSRVRPRSSAISGAGLPRVIGDFSCLDDHYAPSHISTFALAMRRHPTKAEREFNKFLLSLNGGALRGRFEVQHVASGDWIIDFFFPEIRLGVEIDGSIHQTPDQKKLDRRKERDCARFDITLLRITNSEVFGDRDRLRQKLRHGWRQAAGRENKIIGSTYLRDAGSTR